MFGGILSSIGSSSVGQAAIAAAPYVAKGISIASSLKSIQGGNLGAVGDVWGSLRGDEATGEKAVEDKTPAMTKGVLRKAMRSAASLRS